MPDGSICTTTLEMRNGRVQKNTTDCTSVKSAQPKHKNDDKAPEWVRHATSGSAAKYLQDATSYSFLDVGADSLQAMDPLSPGALLGQGPRDDLWILGGAFFERHVVCFDFEKARLGFAEPAVDIEPELQPVVLAQEVRAVDGRRPEMHWRAWTAASAALLLAGVGTFVARRSRLGRDHLLASAAASDTEAVE